MASLLIPEVGLLFWMLLSFGIVFGILAKFGFPLIINSVESRKKYIDDSLKVAKDANEQLAQLKSEADHIISEANKEQGRILRQAQEEKNSIVLEAKQEAKELARKELNEVKYQIQQEKEEAIRSIRRQVAVLSVDIAEKVIRKNLDAEKEQMGMIDRMLDEMLANQE